MNESPEKLSHRLKEEGDKTQVFFQALTPIQCEIVIYDEGRPWTIRQVLAHFVSTEMSLGLLIENILAGGEGAPENFDIERFNYSQVTKLGDASLKDLLIQFTQYRAKNIGMVLSMGDDDLARKGRHPFLGVVSIADIIKMIYRHNQIHLRDIKRTLNKN
jgi:hypothetical protein